MEHVNQLVGEDAWQPSDRRCKCGEQASVLYRAVDSSDGGHTDYQYHCQSCNADWWIDGIDS